MSTQPTQTPEHIEQPLGELAITRVFDAPRELVYRAFTDPDQLAGWFGAAGFSVPRETVEIDARVGGHQRFVMVNDADPAQREQVDATFREVVQNELLVGYEIVTGFPGVPDGTELTLRLEFHDQEGGTQLVLRQGPFPQDIVPMADQGWNSAFTKLDALLRG